MIDIAKLEAELNEVLARVFPVSVQPSCRYYKHGKDRYFWTTEAVTRDGKPRYASGIYHYLKTKKAYKLTQPKYHARRKDAKARALTLWETRALTLLDKARK